MSDYISREAAFNGILKLVPKVDNDGYCWVIRGDAATAIESIPAADVRPVVFCKDCVHFIRGEMFGDMVCDYHYLHHYHAEPNEFCSHAEKREGS